MNETYDDKVRKIYAKNTRTMKLTVVNLSIGAVLLLLFSIINVLNNDMIGYFQGILVVYLILLMYYYWKRSMTAKNLIIFSAASIIFFFQPILIYFTAAQILIFVQHNYVIGIPLLIFSGWLIYTMLYVTLANLFNEETNRKFEFPDIIPSDIVE